MDGKRKSNIKKIIYASLILVIIIAAKFTPIAEGFDTNVYVVPIVVILLLSLLIREFTRKNFESVKWSGGYKLLLLLAILIFIILALVASYFEYKKYY